MKLRTLKLLENNAKKYFSWKEFEDISCIDEYVNTACYIWYKDLLNCMKDIDERIDIKERLDTWFIYWNELIDYLTAIVSTHLYNYITEHMKEWGTTLTYND